MRDMRLSEIDCASLSSDEWVTWPLRALSDLDAGVDERNEEASRLSSKVLC